MKVILKCVACLAIWVGAGATEPTEPPRRVFGYGSVPCRTFTDLSLDTSPKDDEQMSERVFAWVEGWFSGRNMSDPSKPLAVGGSLSDRALKKMLVDECYEYQKVDIATATARLYDKLMKAGL